MMRRMINMGLCSLLCLLLIGCGNKNSEKIGKTEVVLETNMGRITLRLYDDTPKHRDNFVRLCKDGFYDGLLWNRIVTESTIQCGDPVMRADGMPCKVDTMQYQYGIPAEIIYPRYFHKKGALAMARQPDEINPKKESSATQFYIVTGKTYGSGELAELHQFMDDSDTTKVIPPFSENQKYCYTTKGGAPHLDGEYTVFGEVVDGIKVVEAIGRLKTDEKEHPVKKVYIEKVTVNQD